MAATKVCTKCGMEKLLADFPVDRSNKAGVKACCKACTAERRRGRQDNMRAAKFGLTLDEYRELMDSYEGFCEACGEECDKPCIDHNHQTGEVRGLLCGKCNAGLGMFDDDPDKLQSAIDYLLSTY